MLRSCFAARGAFGGGTAGAEETLEDHLRIDLHGQRLGGRDPGNRVRVSAAIAFAAVAGIRAGIFDAELQRGQQVVLADLLRDESDRW